MSQPETQPSLVTTPSPLDTLVVVAPDLGVLDSLQGIDGAGPCNWVVHAPRSQAYAQIKGWQPSLVVITMSLDDLEGCQLLTMLAIDPDTRQIPVLVLTTPEAPERSEADGDRWTPFWLESLPALT